MTEIWKDINGYNGRYQVSNFGRVKSLFAGRELIMATQIINSGYPLIHLNYKGKRKAFTVHRLVALHFIPLVDDLDMVDHIDGNKTNNNVSNLRWVNRTLNMLYASQNGLLKNVGIQAAKRMVHIGRKHGFENSQKHLIKAKPLSLEIGGKIIHFRSIRSASIYLGMYHKTLSDRINKGIIINHYKETA